MLIPFNHFYPMNDPASLQIRRRRLQEKLARYGLPAEITYLPYLDYAEVTWQPLEEAAQRMVILQTLSYLAHDLDQREGAADWLMDEGLFERHRVLYWLRKFSGGEAWDDTHTDT